MSKDWSELQRPAQICVPCWEAMPGHSIIRPFWVYCVHWRILALRPPNQTRWVLRRKVTPAHAAESFSVVVAKVYELAPRWPELRAQIVELAKEMRDFETGLLMLGKDRIAEAAKPRPGERRG